MKQKSWVALLAIGPALLLAEEKSTCPVYVPAPPPTALYHSLSMQTEAVAPSARVRAVRPPASASVFPQVVNFIDNDVFNKMRQDGVVPTAIAGDEEFLRRVTLDLTGQIPDSATVQAFVADTTADKRAKKIDQLLASDAFVDRWTMWFGDLVQNVQVSANSREYYIGRNTYYNYIHDSIQSAKPYDQMVRELISGKGDNFVSGAANYWVRQTQANGPIQDQYDNLSAASGQEFLGMPFLCLSCHSGLGHLELVNTYLKSKTRYDFWGEAAFFARTRAQRIAYQDPATKNNVNKYDVEDNTTGAYQLNTTSGNKTPRQPVNGESTVNPAFLLTGEQPRSGEAYRDALGRMLTAHQQFARATVNYLWKEMFALGLVEPTNNIDLNALSTQPINPTLLTDLTSEFIKDKYDLRAILRTMATSSTYQLSTVYTPGNWNESWTPDFARHLAHRLPAEVMIDAIAKATNVGVSFNVNGIGTVTTAEKLPDTLEARGNAYGRFMDEFGRGNRDDQARTNDTSIAQALSLMNDGQVVVNRVHRSTASSTVAKVLASTTDPGSIVDQLYLATLSRRPTATERTQSIAYLAGGNLGQRSEDLQ
ncbi:MAG TPA: DUF1549 domain-containing protein, partial [Thermoanaerobaculia bacterium]|nr:DUF1549 domain-containing protein [Thermoanaerobaculia bacterium]